jgi:predicted metal-dependent hydrolase
MIMDWGGIVCAMNIQINQLVRSKRRTIALIVERDGSLTVRAPQRAALRDIESFIREKAAWVLRTRARLQAIPEVPKKQFVDGEKFLFLGQPYELKLVKPQRPALQFQDGFTLAGSSQKRGEQAFMRWYKGQALKLISARVKVYSERHGLIPKRIKITSARTRWGSCSPDGTLNFTWRLVMAPLEVIDYVVVHELVHLKVKDHSKRFWNSVEHIMPDYSLHRKWLRKHGEKLGL